MFHEVAFKFAEAFVVPMWFAICQMLINQTLSLAFVKSVYQHSELKRIRDFFAKYSAYGLYGIKYFDTLTNNKTCPT